MNIIFILLLGVSVFASPAHASNAVEPSPNAWWVDIVFKPTQLSLKGIPLARFDKEWAYAELLTYNVLSQQISPKDLKEFRSSRFSFEKRVDLNRNGKREIVVVGVYQRENGVQGQFVSIFEQNKLLKTFTKDDKAGFSALLLDKGQVYWSFCMECGGHHSRKLLWKNGDYLLW